MAQLPILGMEVTFYNIGQGNCTLVTCPGQKTMLVDAGSSSAPTDDPRCTTALNNLVTHIINKSPSKELFVVATHADKDHINKISIVCQKLISKEFKLNFLLGGSTENYEKTEIGKKLLTFITNNSKNCTLQFAEDIKGTDTQRFKKFKKIVPSYCTVLSALTNQSDVNDTSLVLKVSDKNASTLLPGDATGNATDEILADTIRKALMKADSFQVSHHGAETHNCTSIKLLLAVNPKQIIISSGLMYEHPRFEVIKTLVTYCTQKKLTNAPHHMLTYQHSGQVVPYTGKTDETRLNPVAINENGFCTAQTTYPIYNTVDSGTITYNQQGINVSNKQSTHNQRGLGALQGIQTSLFNGIRFLFFNNMELESAQLKQTFPVLPSALEYMDLRNNLIGHIGIEHLITQYKKHKNNLIVKLGDNRLVDKKSLTTVCNKKTIKSITSKNRIIATFSNKGLAKDTIESLDFRQGISGNAPIQHAQAKDFAQDNSKDSEDACKNKLVTISDDTEHLVFELSNDKKNLYIERSDDPEKGYNYSWTGITDICLLTDSNQTVAGITTNKCSTLFDFEKDRYKELVGQFRYTKPSKPWKTIGKEFWTLNTPGLNYYHERTPFSNNGKFVMTVSEKDTCINIYQIDELSFDPHNVTLYKSITQEHLKNDLGHEISDIKRISFSDLDHSVELHFKDKTNGELRYILEPKQV